MREVNENEIEERKGANKTKAGKEKLIYKMKNQTHKMNN